MSEMIFRPCVSQEKNKKVHNLFLGAVLLYKFWHNSPIFSFRYLPLIFLSLAFFAGHSSVKSPGLSSGAHGIDSVRVLKLGFAGDLMCHKPIFESSRVNSGSFDFNPIYKYISEYLSAPDVMIGNLETVTAGKVKGYTGYPQFNTPDEYISALKKAGFDFLVTSNNHSMDRGEKGVLRTLEILSANGIPSTGTFQNETDRDSIRIINPNGIAVAILNYTFGTNGIPLPRGKDYLVNRIDTNLIKSDIEKALSLKPDVLLLFYHFGTEYKRTPDEYQERIVEFSKRAGADIIIGSHPHVVEKIEKYLTVGGRLDTGFVAYSLGNFLSNQQWRYADAGVILNLSLEKNLNSGRVRISEITPVPTMVYISRHSGKRQYYILPASENIDTVKLNFLKKSEIQRLKNSYSDTKGILYSGAN